MTTFRRSASRLPAWAASVQPRPQTIAIQSCSAIRQLHATSHTAAPHALPPPVLRHPSPADIRNAQLRKAPLSSADVELLKALPSRLSELSAERARVAKSVDEVGGQIRILRDDAAQQAALEELQKKAGQLRLQARDLSSTMQELQAVAIALRSKVPNDTHPASPRGAEEHANVVKVWTPHLARAHGVEETLEAINSTKKLPIPLSNFPEPPAADEARDHVHQCETLLPSSLSSLGSTALVPAQSTSGPGFYHLLPPLSTLSHAISSFALVVASRHGFVQVGSPDVIRADVSTRCGFDPRDVPGTLDGNGAQTSGVPSQTYFVTAGPAVSIGGDASEGGHGHNSADLVLAATAEIPLAGLLAGKTITFQTSSTNGAASGPIKLASLSHAFRAEAGARGRATRGLYRLHQFDKVELFVACEGAEEGSADESQSDAILEELRGIQEEVMQKLQLPYRVLDMPTEELGASAYRKYDIEAWMPGRGAWGEVSSASNCTDFQSRRLHIRSVPRRTNDTNGKSKKSSSPSKPFVHTLNATAAAIPRLIIALMEVHGVHDGKLRLPDTIKPYWLANEEQVAWFSAGEVLQTSGTALGMPANQRTFATSARTPADRSYSTAASRPPPPKRPSAFQRGVAALRALSVRTGTDPASLILSFAILHELTAFLPLVIIFWIFTSFGLGERFLSWLGISVGDEVEAQDVVAAVHDDMREEEGLLGIARAKVGQWTEEGIKRGRRFGERKGYFGMEKRDKGDPDSVVKINDRFSLAGPFADAVAAYVLVKALMPIRIAMSISLAPRFSRAILEPVKRLYRRIRPSKS